MSGFPFLIHLHFLLRSALCLPRGAPPRLRAAWRILAPLAVLLWSLVIASVWWSFPPRVLSVVHNAAGTVAVIAALCWVAGILSADGRRELTRQNADLYQRIPEDQRPPLLRSAR